MWLLPISVLIVSVIVAFPLGGYLAWIMDGRYRPPRLLRWCEERVNSGSQNWKQYAVALLVFNTVLYAFGYVVLSLQPHMPINPRGLGAIAPSTIFNTVISFSTNTDIQHYSGDVAFSNFSQLFFCLPMFFLSAAIGFCALTAIIRALRSDPDVGNFF
jgi:potassium-transporting ATPase potassium-binding subunit